jgi:translocation and assembly module TamB
MELTWFPLAVQFYGIAAQSRDQNGKDPLFIAARATVNLKLLPLLHRRIEIQKIDIDRPAIYVRTDAHGRTNLPTPPNNGPSNSSFQTQVALLIIRNGLIDYDDRQIPLSAELRNFHSQVALDRATNSYKGLIAYDAGRIETPNVRTFEHSMELHLVADATHCVVESLDLATWHSHLRAHGDLTEYKTPVFTGGYQAAVSGDDLRWIMKNTSVPAGDISLQGEIAYRSTRGQSVLDQTRLTGNMESGALTVSANASKVVLKQLRGAYRLERGQLYVDGVRAEAFGGRVTSDSDVINLKSSGGRVHLAIRDAAIQQAGNQLALTTPRGVQLAGLANLDIVASWKNSVNDATVQARGVIRRPAEIPPAKDIIPLEGHLSVDYDAARDRATFGPSDLRTGSAQLNITGVLSRNSSLNVHFATSDLDELAALVDAAAPSSKPNGIAAYDLHGSAEFTGKASGAVKNPHLDGQLTASNLVAEGTTWRVLQAHVGIDSRFLTIDDGSLTGQNKEHLSFKGSTKLANWSLDPEAPLSLQARIQNIPAAEVQRLGKTSYPLAGVLNGEIALSGSERSPQGRGHIDLVEAVVWNEPVNAFALDFNADRQIVCGNANVSAPAGALTAKVTYDLKLRRYEIQGQTRNLKLEQVHVLQQTPNSITGLLTAEVSGSGTLDDPQLTARAQIPSLVIRGETFTAADAQITMRNKHADLSLRSTVEQSAIQVKGTVELNGAYPAKLALDTGNLAVGPLLAKYMPGRAQGTTGQLEIHATFNGPLKEPKQIQAHAEIPTMRLQTKTIDLANAKAIDLDYRAGVLQVNNAELKGKGTDLRLNGSYPVQASGDMNVATNGTLDLGLLQDWTNGGHSSGQVNVELHAKGNKAQPVLQGRAGIVNAAYTSDDLPVGIGSLNGDISMDGNHLQIANLSGTAGGGTFSLGGSGVYGNNSSFNLALEAKSVRVRQNGVRAVVDANLSLIGATTASTLGGSVTVDNLSFNQGSDLAEIISQLSGDNTVSDPSSSINKVKLNVAVQSSDNLNLASSQLSIAGSANLNVVGTLADPVILGRVALTSGEVFFLGKRFEIQNGTIAFANTVHTESVVNLYVNTVVDQYKITIKLTGPMDRLKTTYTSDPSLSTADIINLLAFGQTTADAASTASTPASVGAESAVASAAGSQVASQVQKLTGISQLTLNPLAGNNQNPGSQVAVQQRVSGNILLTFSTDVTSAQNQSIQVQYRAKRNVTVSVLRDENGGYGFDVRYHKAF